MALWLAESWTMRNTGKPGVAQFLHPSLAEFHNRLRAEQAAAKVIGSRASNGTVVSGKLVGKGCFFFIETCALRLAAPLWLEELSGKCDMNQMSSQEYKDLVNYLVDKGVIASLVHPDSYVLPFSVLSPSPLLWCSRRAYRRSWGALAVERSI